MRVFPTRRFHVNSQHRNLNSKSACCRSYREVPLVAETKVYPEDAGPDVNVISKVCSLKVENRHFCDASFRIARHSPGILDYKIAEIVVIWEMAAGVGSWTCIHRAFAPHS